MFLAKSSCFTVFCKIEATKNILFFLDEATHETRVLETSHKLVAL